MDSGFVVGHSPLRFALNSSVGITQLPCALARGIQIIYKDRTLVRENLRAKALVFFEFLIPGIKRLCENVKSLVDYFLAVSGTAPELHRHNIVIIIKIGCICTCFSMNNN